MTHSREIQAVKVPNGRPFSAAARAFVDGCWSVIRMPGLFLLVWMLTLVAAAPFAVVLAGRLQQALAHQPPISLQAEEIDAEWWLDFRSHATGLERTFTPAIIGFAAPLDNLSAILDASPRSLVLAGPLVLFLALWAFLWGGILDRYQRRQGTLRSFAAAGSRYFRQMLIVSAAAGAIVLLLYLTVHVLLFQLVFPSVAASLSSERDAFVVRVVFYAVFVALLASVSLTADYTRIAIIRAERIAVRDAVISAIAFIRRQWGKVLSLYLTSALLFVGLLAVYGLADRRFGGWRAVLIGQAYIVARLAIRLVNAASELRLQQLMATAHDS